ncbi:hypothetical protein ACTM7X_15360 [Citrobacter braakii]
MHIPRDRQQAAGLRPRQTARAWRNASKPGALTRHRRAAEDAAEDAAARAVRTDRACAHGRGCCLDREIDDALEMSEQIAI